MEKVTNLMWKNMLKGAAEEILKMQEHLTEADMQIGDGDHGQGMARGFLAVKNFILNSDIDYIDRIAEQVGITLIKTMGGASGVIFGTMFIGGSSCLPHKEEMTVGQMVSYFRKGEQDVERRGKAKAGMKTMVDALDRACFRMERAIEVTGCESSLKEVIYQGWQGAIEGARETMGMLPKKGRSKNFREKALGLADPGALSVSYIFEGMWKSLQKKGDTTYA